MIALLLLLSIAHAQFETFFSLRQPVAFPTPALLAAASPGIIFTQTDQADAFIFTVPHGDYILKPQPKIGDLAGALSALDAAYILQYLVGLRSFTPYQIIAADVNGSGAVTALDGSLILQKRVGLISKLPISAACGTDFIFVPDPLPASGVTADSPNVNIANCTNGAIEYRALSGTLTHQDFVSVAFGDVTGNWVSALPSLRYSLSLQAVTLPLAEPLPDATPLNIMRAGYSPSDRSREAKERVPYHLEGRLRDNVLKVQINFARPAISISAFQFYFDQMQGWYLTSAEANNATVAFNSDPATIAGIYEGPQDGRSVVINLTFEPNVPKPPVPLLRTSRMHPSLVNDFIAYPESSRRAE